MRRHPGPDLGCRCLRANRAPHHPDPRQRPPWKTKGAWCRARIRGARGRRAEAAQSRSTELPPHPLVTPPTQVARQEGRIILTSGQPFHKLRAQVGAGRCLSVDCSLKAQQQAKAVLKHFNVRVTHADIFSRCQVTRPPRARRCRSQAQPQRQPLGAAPMTVPAAGCRRLTCGRRHRTC
ncbi:PREDICTED: uncharacterized protein LOC105580633 [Cercocebus atys]|uniref:uncharacterized protein LOC105580633 n=1 Tax=Cercocebus atys TaxID=9531 RepID=UPI0005F4254D|nr:PREDICTED: uncharacterized protein LOC105580633 [Cercocebus atys]